MKKHEPNLENGGKERPGSFERLLKAPDRASTSHPTEGPISTMRRPENNPPFISKVQFYTFYFIPSVDIFPTWSPCFNSKMRAFEAAAQVGIDSAHTVAIMKPFLTNMAAA